MNMRRNVVVLVASNLFGGVGVAASVAVVSLLTEQIANTQVAGFAQAVTSLGAGLSAVPLANLAARRGRRISLGLGYLIPIIGALTVIIAAIFSNVIVLFAGLALFGVAQAVNLQSRYAAAENAGPAARARTMSVVIWATTVGSVVGPNLIDPGDSLGTLLGLPQYAGTYILSMVAYALAATVIALWLTPNHPTARTQAPQSAVTAEPVGALAALRWSGTDPRARFGVVATGSAHAVMVMVMVMTPLYMVHEGMALSFVGVVVSLHILGMYGLSPVFGWAADRFGAVPVSVAGMGVLVLSTAMGFVAATYEESSRALTPIALVILGVGWSMVVIAASSLLANVREERVRVPLQGANDAIMNYAGAAAAAASGLLLAWAGFQGVNVVATIILVPAALLSVSAFRASGGAGTERDLTPQTSSPGGE
ncbi:MAG TPA: MFS transporter [Beutenbergiaceae bacterium]|nr:MFS transporter [Beutenbergiaceae bacterium]